MLTENALSTMLEMGVKEIEIFFNSPSELKKKYVKQLRQMVKDYGAHVRSVHPYSSMMEPFMFFTNYERRFDDMMDMYKEYFEAANILDAEIVVIHGDKLPAKQPDEKYFERFKRIIDAGKKQGVYVAQENVNFHRSQSPEFLKAMKEWIGDDLKFVFDIKQSVRAGYDPYDFAQRLGSSIVHIHVSDNDKSNTCLIPGRGIMDYSRLRSIVEGNGCDPNWIIEVYRTNFEDTQEIKNAIKILKNAE